MWPISCPRITNPTKKTAFLIQCREVVFLFSSFLFSALLTLSVVLVNGWTDAPNAIATAVGSGSLSFRKAVALSAGFNFLGVWLACLFTPAVTTTIYSIAHFGTDSFAALSALNAAMAAIVVWAVLAWRFGIPTSESHALVSGVTGAAVALQGSFLAIHWESWGKVLFGLLFSLLLGFLMGGVCLPLLPRKANYRPLQILGAALMSFLHGAQDGQKFAGIFLLSATLAAGKPQQQAPLPSFPLIALVALFMAFGTLLGGRRIINTLCRDMTHLPPREGFSADLGAGVTLALATLLGFPVSTTHVKTSAILGAGTAAGLGARKKTAEKIAFAWLATFPACFGLGYLFVRLLV